MRIHQRINFKQPKYMLPLIVYLPILVTGYLVIDMFQTEIKDVDSNMQTTEYINPNLPSARVRGDGVGGKYENMLKSFGKIDDRSAVTTIERDEEKGPTEEYESRYTDEDMAIMDAEAALQDSLLRMRMQNEIFDENERIARRAEEQQKALDEMNKALAKARLDNTAFDFDDIDTTLLVQETEETVTVKEVNINTKAVQAPSANAEPEEVVRKVKESSDFFNTISENEPEGLLIKAIIDEEIKAVDGSRIRLRLLDDIEIKEEVLPKGTYLYATMSGFGSQRVKGKVSSVLYNDKLIKINLSIYDTDGLEGLYVPQSSFRETAKDVASGAMSNNMNIRSATGTTQNMLADWGMQAIQQAYQSTTSAISKAITKNKVKLKYGTQVYLINSGNSGSR